MTVGITQSAATIFAPTQSNGAARRPSLADAQRWGVEVERILDSTISNGPIFASVAAAAANLNWVADTMAWVVNATAPAENGIYRKVGASGTGSWVRVGDLPYNDVNIQNAIDAAEAAQDAQLAAESAAEAAQSAAGSNLANASTRAAAMATTIPAQVRHVRTAGHTTSGDGGGALYLRVTSEPSHVGKFRSVDRWLPNGTESSTNGGWWELAERVVRPEMIGTFPNSGIGASVGIQSAIDVAVAIGARRVELSPGVYLVNSVINLASGIHLAGVARQSLLENATNVSTFILANGISDFAITDLDLDNTMSGSDGNFSGIVIQSGSTRGFVMGNRIRDMRGNGIDLNSGNSDIIVTGNFVSNCRVGISVFKGNTDCDITGNTVADCREMGINVDDATSGDTALTASPNFDVNVVRNVVRRCGYSAGGVGIAWQGSFYGRIADNTVRDCGRGPATWVSARGIVVNAGQDNWNRSAYTQVIGNQVRDCTAQGIHIVSGVGVNVSGNTVLSNWQWQSALTGVLAEIEIAGSASFPSESCIVSNNLINNTGGTSRATHGVSILSNATSTLVAGQVFMNLSADNRYDIQIGSHWSGIESISSEPSFNSLHSGRIYYNTATGALRLNNASSWFNL